MRRPPKRFQWTKAVDVKPGDKIWMTYDGERSVKAVDRGFNGSVLITMRGGRVLRIPEGGDVLAYTPSPTATEDRTKAAVAAVEWYVEDRGTFNGLAEDARPVVVDSRHLISAVRDHNFYVIYVNKSPLSTDFTSADLRRAARLGRIVCIERMGYNGGTVRLYTSITAKAAAEAERALSDEARIKRFMDTFVPEYEASQHRGGDNARLWPEPVRGYGDGAQLAIESGLIVEVGKDFGGRATYVPADRYDAYVDALAEFEGREKSALAHYNDVKSRLLAISGGGLGRTVELPLEAAERLLELLEQS